VRDDLIPQLRCPECQGAVEAFLVRRVGGLIETGTLECDAGHSFPVDRFIPRFVASNNYAGNFGLQWNAFRQTQLDSVSGTSISHDRFFLSTGWSPEEMAGKRVLDVGCGAGRFTEVALSTGAQVIALDYSSAVEACWANNRDKGNLEVVQGDIYSLPFDPASFDFVYCLGVLQHTPDVEAAFEELPKQIRAGGRLAVDIYPKLWRNALSSKDWVRPLTKRMNPERLFRLVERDIVPTLLPISRLVGRLPFGRQLRRLIPVSNYEGIFPLSREQLQEWAVLDTYDMLAPRYDQPQTAETLHQWFADAGMTSIEVFRSGHLIGRANKS
jgi:SAM-dependent methyltransferase